MNIIVLPRRGGKTHRLLEWMRSAPDGEHRVMLCFSAHDAMRLWRQVREQEGNTLESWQFVSAGDIKDGAWSGVLRGRGGRIVIGVDNADMILQRMLEPWTLGAVSMDGYVSW